MQGIHRKRILLAFLIIIWFTKIVVSQSTDYEIVFGKDWQKAEAFVTENESWMKQLSDKYNITYPLAIAVVFPELVRYSALRDKIEITLLKALYTNLGEEYADFSIGPFQMKPSFAELINEKAIFLKDRKIRYFFIGKTRNKDKKQFRSMIVADLENLKTQFIYLAAFIQICESSYPECQKNEIKKLKFLSTVYNAGLNKSSEAIEAMMDQKYFNTRLIKTGDNYSYAEISLYWYNSFVRKK